MTLEQEIRLAAKHAAQAAAQEAYEKAYKEAEAKKEIALKKAAENNARKMKTKNIPDDVIAECTGLSLQQVQEL